VPRDAAEVAIIAAADVDVARWTQHVVPVLAQDYLVTEDEVRCALRRTASYKAPGPDGLPAELMKGAGRSGTQMLQRLFNSILVTTSVPSSWRRGSISSIHKSGDRADCGNYRGITLLPTMDKLFMSILINRVQGAAPFHPRQYAFVRGRGTAEASFNLMVTIEGRRQRRLPTYAFFLDIRKAFDTIVRSLLLQKLHGRGITGRL
jgi:Reverse transcriptase (RNA-dependent DNA polymerase)